MIKRNKRLLIVIGILSFLLLVLLFGVNYFYYENTFREAQIDHTNKSTEQTERSISLSLINDYKVVNRILDDNLDLDEAILQGGVKISKTFNFENNYLTIDDNSYLVNNLTLQNSEIAFYKINDLLNNKEEDELFEQSFLVFYYEEHNIMILIDSVEYLDKFIDFEKTINYVVMNPNGYFYVINDNPNNATNLTSFIKTPDDTIIKEFIRDDKLGGVFTIVNKEEVFVSVKSLDNNQYLLLIYPEISVFNETKSVLYIFIVTTISAYIILVLSFILGLIAISKRFNDIEMNRFNVYYNKPPIIYINNKGVIKGFNKTFKRDYPVYKNIIKLNNIFINPIDELMLLIKKQSVISGTIPLNERLINISFIPLKARLGYALVGIKQMSISEEGKYKSLALFNEVTNLPNLNSFLEFTKEVINNLNTNDSKYTFLMLNIVDFKNVNRLIGENTANELIKDISNYLIDESPYKDLNIFNTKIDNFILVFKDLKNNESIIKWANSISEKYQHKMTEKNLLALDIRFGIYNTDERTRNLLAVDIYKNLNQATEFARTLATKSVVVYDQTTESYYKNITSMEEDLLKAIENDEFEMYLQPQLNNITNKIVGFEALIRWINPKYQYVSAETYIKLAEANNYIIDIGRITMKKSFELAKRLEGEDVVISMNVSPVQILQIGFVQEFIEEMEKFNIKPGSIAIEITETVLMSSFSLINEKIRQLKKNGVQIHLDDFGTGYSSLKYLEQLNVDTIKIDREFIVGYPQDKFKRETVKFITNLAKSLNLEVIAEGVETKAQNDHLRKNGANIIQGYLISKAVSYKEAFELLKKYNHSSEGEVEEWF